MLILWLISFVVNICLILYKKRGDDIMAINTENKKTRLDENAEIYSEHKTISEKEMWKSMDTEEKKKQFKEYYLIPIIVGILAVGIVGYLIYDAVSGYRDVSFMATIINDEIDSDTLDDFNDDFLNYIGGNPKKDKSDISAGYLLSGGSGSDSVRAAQSLTSYIYAKQLDAMIADEATFDHYASLGCFLDLSELLTNEEYAKYEKYIYYPRLEENVSNVPGSEKNDTVRPEKTYPCGIHIGASPVYKKLGGVQPDPVIGIVATSGRRENALKFLKYLFPEEGK